MTLKSSLPNPTQPDWSSPGLDAENVDLSATDYIPSGGLARGFYILTATGTVKIDTPAGNTITIPTGLSTGVPHPIAFTKMYKVGTTATGILAIG